MFYAVSITGVVVLLENTFRMVSVVEPLGWTDGFSADMVVVLFPFNCCRWFAGDVVHNPVNPPHLVYNPA